MDVPQSFAELVIWIGTPGFALAVLSLVAEHVPAFQRLSSGWKFALFVTIPVILAGISYALSTQGVVEFLSAYDPLLQAIVIAVSGVIGSQLWHRYFNQGNTPQS